MDDRGLVQRLLEAREGLGKVEETLEKVYHLLQVLSCAFGTRGVDPRVMLDRILYEGGVAERIADLLLGDWEKFSTYLFELHSLSSRSDTEVVSGDEIQDRIAQLQQGEQLGEDVARYLVDRPHAVLSDLPEGAIVILDGWCISDDFGDCLGCVTLEGGTWKLSSVRVHTPLGGYTNPYVLRRRVG